MQEVAHGLETIKKIYEELMEAYKHFFQAELKNIQEKLY